MTLEKLLQILAQVAKEEGISTPYIVGGVPRNIVLGQLKSIKDVDLTTGNADIDRLADAFAKKIGLEVRLSGQHKSVRVKGISFDFSTNFMYEKVDQMLNDKGILNPSNLKRETFSRDFTTNTLMLDLDLETIVDITGQGREDTLDKVLRCPLDCSASFIHDPKRILRAFYFKALYGYTFSDEVKKGIERNALMLKTVKPQYASQILNRIVEKKPDMIDELVEMGLMQYLPLTKFITNMLLEKKKILDVL